MLTLLTRYITVLGFTAWLLKEVTSTITVSDGVRGLDLIVSLGFGKVNNRTMLNTALKDLVTNAMLANTPQVILSWTYFSYNGLLTLISLAREWESYTLQKKGLRVSVAPEGDQRAKYFLQVPYRIAVPFSLLSALLHWLVSQSFFLVNVQLYSYDGTEGWEMELDNPATRISCGYSPLPLLILLVTGGVLLVAIFAQGLMKFKTGTPVVASCSAAIAAVCQPFGDDDGEAATEKVQWGVIGCKQKYGHCGVSRRPVGPLIEGDMYR